MNTTCLRGHHIQERLFSTNTTFVGGKGRDFSYQASWNLRENKRAVPDLSNQGNSPNGRRALCKHIVRRHDTHQSANSGQTKDTSRRRRPRSERTNSLTRRLPVLNSWCASLAGPQGSFLGASVQQPATVLVRPGCDVRPGTYDSLNIWGSQGRGLRSSSDSHGFTVGKPTFANVQFPRVPHRPLQEAHAFGYCMYMAAGGQF